MVTGFYLSTFCYHRFSLEMRVQQLRVQGHCKLWLKQHSNLLQPVEMALFLAMRSGVVTVLLCLPVQKWNIRVEWVEGDPCSTVMLFLLGSHFLEMFANKMQVLHGSDIDPVDDKELHNVIFILTTLYNFKVRKSQISNWNLVKLVKKLNGEVYFQQRDTETTFKFIKNEIGSLILQQSCAIWLNLLFHAFLISERFEYVSIRISR